jgi:hypothetical protein
MSAGKGSKPRNCFSKQFKDNYDTIIWRYQEKAASKVKCIKCGGTGKRRVFTGFDEWEEQDCPYCRWKHVDRT